MNNSFLPIYGKTIDGRDIALDGYKVESFAFYTCNNDEILEIVFNSGQKVRVLSDLDAVETIEAQLVSSMQVDKSTIPAPNPDCLVRYVRTDGYEGLFDCNAIEFLITYNLFGVEYVEVHFSSGTTFTVFASELDRDGNSIDNLVDDYISRHR